MNKLLKKYWLVPVIILPLIFWITTQYNTPPPTTYNVGMVLSNIENPFFQAINTGAKSEAAQSGINLKVLI